MDLPDDTYLGEPEATVQAAAMREILGRDLEESEIAELVYSFDGGSHEYQQAAWMMLTTSERRAWHAYRTMAADKRRANWLGYT